MLSQVRWSHLQSFNRSPLLSNNILMYVLAPGCIRGTTRLSFKMTKTGHRLVHHIHWVYQIRGTKAWMKKGRARVKKNHTAPFQFSGFTYQDNLKHYLVLLINLIRFISLFPNNLSTNPKFCNGVMMKWTSRENASQNKIDQFAEELQKLTSWIYKLQ